MSDVTGVARLRRAIENQASLGEASFSLPVDEARAICDECEDELPRLSLAAGVPAPVDADGEIVPLTTKVMYDDDGEEHDVSIYRSFIWSREKGRWCFGASIGSREVASLHLHRPDSWERLEEDVSKAEDKGICGYFGFAMNRPCSAECPARDVRDSCAVTAMHDVMRRAEALAERDGKGAERD